MSSFNSTCIAWVHGGGCPAPMRSNFAIMCKVFFACTTLTILFLLANVLRRVSRLSSQNIVFKTIMPQLLAWAVLQLYYQIMRGFFPNDIDTPTELLSLANLISQSVLGSTVLKLILAWIAIHQTVTHFHSDSYIKRYWIIVGGFLFLTTVSSVLTGVSPKYYYVAMRVTLAIWVLYLLICIILLMLYGVHVYLDAVQAKDGDANVKRTRQCIPIMLSLYGTVFVIVLVGFVFYASCTELVERSKVWPLLIWAGFWTGSIVYVNIWNIYFWRTVASTVN